MACGTPVIAIKEGGFRETVRHNQTGLLIEREPRELAKAILYLMENKDIWEKFSKNGFQWIKSNFSLKRMVDQIEREIYDLILR